MRPAIMPRTTSCGPTPKALGPAGAASHERIVPESGDGGDRRRRDRRLLDRIQPRHPRLQRCRSPGEAQAHLGLDVACSRCRRPAAHERQRLVAARPIGRNLQSARGGNGPGHRLAPERLAAARDECRSPCRIRTGRDHGALLWPGDGDRFAPRGEGALSAARRGRLVCAAYVPATGWRAPPMQPWHWPPARG